MTGLDHGRVGVAVFVVSFVVAVALVAYMLWMHFVRAVSGHNEAKST